MTDLYVDVDAVRQLVGALTGIHDSLERATDGFEAGAAATGSAAVRSALVSFGDGWRDGRRKITSEIATLARAARGSAQSYAEAESQIAAQARRGSP